MMALLKLRGFVCCRVAFLRRQRWSTRASRRRYLLYKNDLIFH